MPEDVHPWGAGLVSICIMKRQWKHEELVEYWILDVEDRVLLSNKTGATRLGFAVLLKFFRQEGRFPQHKNEVSAWQGRTIEYHRAQIREALGFRESSVADGEQMQTWLVAEIARQCSRNMIYSQT